jgi:hypothetical protein
MAGVGAIRDVGTTLVGILQAAVDSSVIDPSNIKLALPRDFEALDNSPELALSLFPYRVAISSDLRNARQRTLPDGRIAPPPLPLEVGLLVTPWARDAADTLLLSGMVARAFQDRAELTVNDLQGGPWRADDTVQLVLDSLPIADHYRIWDTTRVPYRLSLTYQARVIGIDPTEPRQVGRVLDAQFDLTRA